MQQQNKLGLLFLGDREVEVAPEGSAQALEELETEEDDA